MTVHIEESPTAALPSEYRQLEPSAIEEFDLQRRVTNFLARRGIPTQLLRVEEESGTVIVRGCLPSLHAKWLCLECCRHVAGVMAVVDDIEVGSTAEAQPVDDDDDLRRRRPR